MDEGVLKQENLGENTVSKQKVDQEEIHDLLFSEKLGWQAIIYDLINTEQLDPWDMDISLLSGKYMAKIKELESANFFVSSKVLLAASLLLRIKSEILLSRDIPSLDDILFGKEDKKESKQERLELDEDVPELIPRTPLPRHRKVTLQELLSALGKAIKTENRRIQKVVVAKQQEIETAISLPKKTVNLQDKMKEIYGKLLNIFKNNEEKLPFSEFSGKTPEERISHFIPLLHLDNQKKVWLDQEGHLEEIYILLKDLYEKQNSEEIKRMKDEVQEYMKQLEVKEEIEEKSGFDEGLE